VRHRRLRPVGHEFRYSMFMMYVDLDELPELFDGRWLWSARRFAPAWFRRADYLGDPAVPLPEAVRDTVRQALGKAPAGPIRLLTHLRYFGYIMNPVSFYYCFGRDDKRVEVIVAEITNTPWRERHAYVLDASTASEPGAERFAFRKAFHVSPFMDMEMDYVWRLTTPGSRVAVHMENFDVSGKLFDATMVLRREPLTGAALAGALARYPLMTAQVAAGIYWQALRLRLRGTPFFIHPRKRLT
jgi:DUF1365 family protein